MAFDLDLKSQSSVNPGQVLDSQLDSFSDSSSEAGEENIRTETPEAESSNDDYTSRMEAMFEDKEEEIPLRPTKPGVTKVEKSSTSKPGGEKPAAADSSPGDLGERLKQLAAKHNIPASIEELAKGFMRTADYTRKTQELKALREKTTTEYQNMSAYADKIKPLADQAINFQTFLDKNEDVRGLILDVLDWKKENPGKPLVEFTKFYIPAADSSPKKEDVAPSKERKEDSSIPSIISGKSEKSQEKLNPEQKFVQNQMLDKTMDDLRKQHKWDFDDEVAEEVQRITYQHGFSTFEPAMAIVKVKEWENSYREGRIIPAHSTKQEEEPSAPSNSDLLSEFEKRLPEMLEKYGIVSRTKGGSEAPSSHSGKQSGVSTIPARKPKTIDEANELMRKAIAKSDAISFT